MTLNENDIGPYRTFLKLSPPLRTEDDRRALVGAVASGLIDVLMSDHNPQDVEVKRLPFAEAASGAIGLETMLPAALRLIHNGEMDFKTLIRAMSTRPAELLGLPGDAARGLPRRRYRDRCGHSVDSRSRRSQIAMQEHAVRRSAVSGALCGPWSGDARYTSMYKMSRAISLPHEETWMSPDALLPVALSSAICWARSRSG